jgi:hypothetical protein
LTAVITGREDLLRDGAAAGCAAQPDRIDNRLLVLSALSYGAGAIHAVAAGEHVAAGSLVVALFALAASAQFAWGLAVYLRPGRGLLWAGVVINLAIVAVWIASRSAGLPIGEHPGSAEPIGLLDSVATADELVLAGLASTALVGRTRQRGYGRGTQILMASGVSMILCSALALVGGHTHSH